MPVDEGEVLRDIEEEVERLLSGRGARKGRGGRFRITYLRLDHEIPREEVEKALREGHYTEAAALYAGLVESFPKDAGLHFSYAVTLGFLDRGDECREEMIKAYAIDNAYLRGFFQLARVLGANGRVEAGEALLATPDLEKTLPALEMDYQRGLFYSQAGLYPQAVEILSEVAAKRPKDFAIRTVLYRAYEEMGETRKMYSTLEDLVEIDDGRVTRDMPWVFKKLGDLAWNFHLDPVAAKWYARYLDIVPGDPDSVRMRELVDLWKDKDTSPRTVE